MHPQHHNKTGNTAKRSYGLPMLLYSTALYFAAGFAERISSIRRTRQGITVICPQNMLTQHTRYCAASTAQYKPLRLWGSAVQPEPV